MRKAIKRQRTIVGRLQREVGRKMNTLSQAVQEAVGLMLDKAKRLIQQTAVGNRAKLYSWHAPEAECISKGKTRNPYEFGVKVRLAMTLMIVKKGLSLLLCLLQAAGLEALMVKLA